MKSPSLFFPVFLRQGGVTSLRDALVFCEHENRFLGDHEELVVSHRALSRVLFAQAALMLAAWIVSKPEGA